MMAKEIILNTGDVVFVDDADYEWLTLHKWFLDGDGYAKRTDRSGSRGRHVSMHRKILTAPAHLEVDHIDGNRLNNQRSNLRLVTRSQNAQNLQGARRDSRTGVRGVEFVKGSKKPYRAYLYINGRHLSFGFFANLNEADAAVREARRQHMTHSSECVTHE